MKQFKKVAVAVVLFIAATSFVQAQSKIAHINVTELLSQMPEMKAAQAELKKLEETYRADIQSSLDELKNKLTQYNNEASSLSQEENQKRALELQGYERNIGEAQQAAQQELAKKQAEDAESNLRGVGQSGALHPWCVAEPPQRPQGQ